MRTSKWDPAEHAKLLGPILNDGAPVVYGSRFLGRPRQLSVNGFANLVLTTLTNILYGARISDMETAYKMVRRDVFDRLVLECRRFDFEPEITAKLLRCGYKIIELPSRIRQGRGSRARRSNGRTASSRFGCSSATAWRHSIASSATALGIHGPGCTPASTNTAATADRRRFWLAFLLRANT